MLVQTLRQSHVFHLSHQQENPFDVGEGSHELFKNYFANEAGRSGEQHCLACVKGLDLASVLTL